MSSSSPKNALNLLLGIDAVTCLTSAVVLTLAAGPIAAATQIGQPLLFWAGLLLFPCALAMALIARSRPVPDWGGMLVIGGNLLWVLASLALPVTGLISPNVFGWAFLLLQAAVVTVLALLEWQAARNRPVAV